MSTLDELALNVAKELGLKFCPRWGTCESMVGNATFKHFAHRLVAELAKQEPVAWRYTSKLTNGEVLTHQPPDRIIEPDQFHIRPLYSAATVERLVQERDEKVLLNNQLADHLGDTEIQLAASQAREQQLREALEDPFTVVTNSVGFRTRRELALDLPHADDATLAYIAQLEEENAALKEHVADHQLLFKDYAAAQHRIKQLRECLTNDSALAGRFHRVLALPDSTAELDAVMKDAQSWRNLENKMKEQP